LSGTIGTIIRTSSELVREATRFGFPNSIGDQDVPFSFGRLPLAASVTALLGSTLGVAQTTTARTYCNPLDIEYKYNFEQINEGISYRSGADPVIVNHAGEYYLFVTVSGGYWHSKDLRHWDFVTPSRWPFEDIVAPAALSVGDTLLLMMSSFQQRPILYSNRPATGRLEFYNRLLPPLPNYSADSLPGRPGTAGPWDPALFRDPDTARWYLYWGSSNVYPIYGIELDPARRLAYKGEVKPLIRLHPERHGWERFGQDHHDTLTPYIEGAWMTKYQGRYYLQYAAPGTEYNVYANGTYVGDDPLGPFTYARYNPVAYKPGGFMTGAGHGNTFQDTYGNWWNTGTPWLAVNWKFERRIAMFPAGFDRDRQMFASTRFGDFPHFIPTRKWIDPNQLFAGWMLLSYRKPVTASSARSGFPASNVTDEDRSTFWVADSNRAGEWLRIALGGERVVRAIQVNYIDYQSGIYVSDSTVYTQFRLQHSRDGKRWETVADLTGERRDRPNAYLELPHPVRTRYIRYEHRYVASPNLAIGDIRVFGNGGGRAPATPRGLSVRRDADGRNGFVSWRPVPGVVGYNVLWGISPAKLYQTYQVFADRPLPLEIRALTVGQDYWFAIEAFDENGVSRLSRPVFLGPS
jgi:xylan 1,4-beta-xylosidase